MLTRRIMVRNRRKVRIYDRDQLRKNVNTGNRIGRNIGPNERQMEH